MIRSGRKLKRKAVYSFLPRDSTLRLRGKLLASSVDSIPPSWVSYRTLWHRLRENVLFTCRAGWFKEALRYSIPGFPGTVGGQFAIRVVRAGVVVLPRARGEDCAGCRFGWDRCLFMMSTCWKKAGFQLQNSFWFINDEKNVSAQPHQTQTFARVPRAHAYRRWSEGVGASACAGSPAIDRVTPWRTVKHDGAFVPGSG